MKNKKIVLLCASALLLSGCGLVKVKTPKNLVSLETFTNSLEYLTKTNSLFMPGEETQAYSFELDMLMEGEKTVTKKSISGKVLHKEETETEAEGKAKFDSVGCIIYSESETTTKVKSNGINKKETEETKTQTQPGSNGVLSLNLVENTYTTHETDKIYEYIHSSAKNIALAYAAAFELAVDEDSACYIDGNRYTVVRTDSSSESTLAYEETITYQLTVKEDSLTLAAKRVYASTLVGSVWTYTTSVENISVELKRKDVSLKLKDTSKLVDISKSSDEYYNYSDDLDD